MRLDFWAILAEKLVTFVSKSKIYRLARDLTELSRKFLDQMPATYHEKSTKTFFAFQTVLFQLQVLSEDF